MKAFGEFVNDVVSRLGPLTARWSFEWTGANVTKWRHFQQSEVEGLDQELVAKLDMAREQAGVPFTITSGKREPKSNIEAGGVGDSSHLKGLAVDLRCSNSLDRYQMIKALLLVGFQRIGVYDQHIHCDLDTTLPQEVIWTGVSH